MVDPSSSSDPKPQSPNLWHLDPASALGRKVSDAESAVEIPASTVISEKDQIPLPPMPITKLHPTDVKLGDEDEFVAQCLAIRRALLKERLWMFGMPLLLLLLLVAGVWWMWSVSQSRSAEKTNPEITGVRATAKQLLLQELADAATRQNALHQLADPGMSKGDERLGYLRRLVESRYASREEELAFCRLALELQRPDDAALVVEPWLKSNTTLSQADRMKWCGEYFSQTGRAVEGLEWVRQKSGTQVSKEERPSPSDLLVARLLLDQPVWSTVELKENALEVALLFGRFLLVEPGDTERELHRDALILMDEVTTRVPMVAEAMGSGAWSEAARKARLLQAGTQDVELLLAGAGFRKRLAGENGLDELLDELGRQFGPEKPTAERLMWARWLLGIGQHDRAALMLGNSPEVAVNREWFLALLDVLAGQRKWKEVEKTMGSLQVLPIEDILARLYLWRCRAESGASPDLVLESRQAILTAAAGATPSVVMYVAHYLVRFADLQAAAVLYRSLFTIPEWTLAARRGLWQALREDPSAEDEVRNCLREYVRMQPTDETAAADLVYLDLLEGLNVVSGTETAARLFKRLPHSLARRTTLALAYMQQERVDDAVALYAGIEPDWQQVPNGFVAIWSAVLTAGGRQEEGIQLAEKVDSSRLRSGERMLLRALMKP